MIKKYEEKELELLDINLQAFAEDDENDESVDNEDADKEVNEEEIDEENKEDEVTEEEIEKKDRVPLDKYLKEKQRRKATEKRLSELESKNSTLEQKTRIEDVRKLVLEKGFDEDLADVLTTTVSQIFDSMPKTEKEDQDILEDIEDFAEYEPSVLKSKKEIIDTVKKYRKVDPDFGVEEALALIKPSKIRVNELKTDIEQQNAIARRKVAKKVVPNSQSGGNKEKYTLSDDEKKSLKGLQQAQPDAKWTAEKLYKLIHKE